MQTCIAKTARTLYIYYAFVILPLFGVIYFYEILYNDYNHIQHDLRQQANFPNSKAQMFSDGSLRDLYEGKNDLSVPKEEILQQIGQDYKMPLPKVLQETDTAQLPLVAKQKTLLDVDREKDQVEGPPTPRVWQVVLMEQGTSEKDLKQVELNVPNLSVMKPHNIMTDREKDRLLELKGDDVKAARRSIMTENLAKFHVLWSRPAMLLGASPYSDTKNMYALVDKLLGWTTQIAVDCLDTFEGYFAVNGNTRQISVSTYHAKLIEPLRTKSDILLMDKEQSQEVGAHLYDLADWPLDVKQRPVRQINFVEDLLDLQGVSLDWGFQITRAPKVESHDQVVCNVGPADDLPVEIRMVSPLQLHFLVQKEQKFEAKNLIQDLRVDAYHYEGNEEGRELFPAFNDATVYTAQLYRDDCVFIPGGWARQVTNNIELEAQRKRVSEKMLLKYDYGSTSPWLNVALS